MKKIMFLLMLIAVSAGSYLYAQQSRIKTNFDFDWKFTLSEPVNAHLASLDDSAWDSIQLPHDWSMSIPYDNSPRGGAMGYMQGGIGWYRKTFDIPEDYRGKKVYIEFDGVYHQSTVYINGKELGFRPYGYVGFEYDLTPHLKYGQKNILAVKVDHSNAPTSRWYSGSGIYRHVWLKVLDPVHVAHWGVYVTTPVITPEKAEVKIVTTVSNTSRSTKKISLQNDVVDINGHVVATVSSTTSLQGSRKTDVTQQLSVPQPVLWDIDAPNLYTLVTTIEKDELIIDRYETPFGIREIRFDADKGFFLNGKNIKMKGTNLHQDAGSLGTAVPDRSYERRLEILKEFGFNAIRCSHNPPSPEFLHYCDRIGFVVVDEIFDKWKNGYYEQYFDKWWQRDLDAMILRDRNHPSIVLWSLGNETGEQGDMTGEGTARLIMMRDHVRKIEPTRKIAVTLAPTNPLNKRTFNQNGFADAVDVVGYNYMEVFYEEEHKNYPQRLIYGSEVYPYYSSNQLTQWSFLEKNPWYDYANNDYVFGYFIWTAVDYLGESNGWPSKGWPTSPFDICMFEKSSAAFLKAVLNEDKPMVSIAVADASLNMDPGRDLWSSPFMTSHWTFPQYEKHVLEIQTITNCEEVELYVNNDLIDRRKTADYSNNTIKWRAPYHKGKILAKGFNNGHEVATFELKTSGSPSRIELTADKQTINADGQDLSHVTVHLLDENGVLVPNDDREITVTVEGAGRLVALDNGDLRDSGIQKRPNKPTYFGKALAVIQSLRDEGLITIKVKAEGIPESQIRISSKTVKN